MAEKLPCEVYAQVYVAKMRVLETQIKWAFLAFSGGHSLRQPPLVCFFDSNINSLSISQISDLTRVDHAVGGPGNIDLVQLPLWSVA